MNPGSVAGITCGHCPALPSQQQWVVAVPHLPMVPENHQSSVIVVPVPSRGVTPFEIEMLGVIVP